MAGRASVGVAFCAERRPTCQPATIRTTHFLHARPPVAQRRTRATHYQTTTGQTRQRPRLEAHDTGIWASFFFARHIASFAASYMEHDRVRCCEISHDNECDTTLASRSMELSHWPSFPDHRDSINPPRRRQSPCRPLSQGGVTLGHTVPKTLLIYVLGSILCHRQTT